MELSLPVINIKLVAWSEVLWSLLTRCVTNYFLPARSYASAGLCDSDVSVRLSVRPSGRPSHAGIVKAKAGS